MGYFKHTASGITWTAILQLLSRFITIAKFVIIARVISPTGLGLFGIVTLTIDFLESISDAGIASFIIQTNKKENAYISSAWVVSIIRGTMLALIVVILSYPISTFFNEKVLNYLLIAAFIPFIRGFINPAIVIFQKNFTFRKEFYYRFTVTLFDFFFTVLLLTILKSPAALVIALILSSFVEVILSFFVVRPLPRLDLDMRKIKEIMHFGKWITLIGITNYFARQADSIFVGKFLGIESLGIYQLSQKFSIQIMTEFGSIFSKVTFPVFSKIRDNRKRVKRAFYRMLFFVSCLGLIMAGLLIIFSESFLLYIAGKPWIVAATPLRIHALTGLITTVMSVVTALFLAFGRQDITAKLILGRLFVLLLLIYPATVYFGIIGTSLISFISYAAVLPLAVFGVMGIFSKKK